MRLPQGDFVKILTAWRGQLSVTPEQLAPSFNSARRWESVQPRIGRLQHPQRRDFQLCADPASFERASTYPSNVSNRRVSYRPSNAACLHEIPFSISLRVAIRSGAQCACIGPQRPGKRLGDCQKTNLLILGTGLPAMIGQIAHNRTLTSIRF